MTAYPITTEVLAVLEPVCPTCNGTGEVVVDTDEAGRHSRDICGTCTGLRTAVPAIVTAHDVAGCAYCSRVLVTTGDIWS
jgi:DnaJ-class molecular chaperone